MIDEELRRGRADDRPACARRTALAPRRQPARLARRGEKLCLYALGAGRIADDDVRAIVGDVSADTVEETVDAAASGEVKRLPHLIDRLTSAGTATFQLHQNLSRFFQQLQAMRELVERHGEPVGRVVERRRPHFRRKPALEAALAAWPLDEIGGVLARIEADILRSRKESALALTITRQTLLDVAVEAARLRARA